MDQQQKSIIYAIFCIICIINVKINQYASVHIHKYTYLNDV